MMGIIEGIMGMIWNDLGIGDVDIWTVMGLSWETKHVLRRSMDWFEEHINRKPLVFYLKHKDPLKCSNHPFWGTDAIGRGQVGFIFLKPIPSMAHWNWSMTLPNGKQTMCSCVCM